MAVSTISRLAEEMGLEHAHELYNCSTVEATIEVIAKDSASEKFWESVEDRLAEMFAQRVAAVPSVAVRLFDMSGRSLSGRDAA